MKKEKKAQKQAKKQLYKQFKEIKVHQHYFKKKNSILFKIKNPINFVNQHKNRKLRHLRKAI